MNFRRYGANPASHASSLATLEERPRSQSLLAALLPSLLETQNADGGWGYRRAAQSRVEPTAWTLLALRKAAKVSGAHHFDGALQRGTAWLRSTQFADGSWPAYPGPKKDGAWVTALASLALLHTAETPAQAIRGASWLCNSWPREGNAWWWLRSLLRRGRNVVQHDSSLRGWSWVPGTASWVEPTAYTLLLLRNLPADLHPPSAAERLRLAEAMLYDRMCPGGGWNLGNPRVYGVAGIPRIQPTAWALLALQHSQSRVENQASKYWLAGAYEKIQGPGSLVLAHVCLETYGHSLPPVERALWNFYGSGRFLMNVQVIAWACLALMPEADVLRWNTARNS